MKKMKEEERMKKPKSMYLVVIAACCLCFMFLAGQGRDCTDNDGDGFAVEGDTCGNACGPVDCDDANPDVFPGAAEGPTGPTCSDGLDNDCDGLIDMNDTGCDSGTWQLIYQDPAGGTILENAAIMARRLRGDFHNDLTLEAEYDYLLDGAVFIGADGGPDPVGKAGTILTIEAGTTIYGLSGTVPGMMSIARGNQIMAEGTAVDPIVFTSALPAGQRSRGDWGGLVINGRSPVNACPAGDCEGEGGSGYYGGSDPADDSGVLRYVRVEFAGHIFTSQNELNGIAFQGVGDGTTVEYVQVHMNDDDGIEMFGGTVNMKYCLITGCNDDQFDWTSGWQGKAQFVAVQIYDDAADRGIESDNLEEDHEAEPTSHPILSNFTFIGGSHAGSDANQGILHRRGTESEDYNFIVQGYFSSAVLDIDDNATFDNIGAGTLVMENVLLYGEGATVIFDESGRDPLDISDWFLVQSGNAVVDPQLSDPYNQAAPDFKPQAGSPALGSWVDPGDAFFDAVDFIGAMDDADDWTAGWTTHDFN